MRDVGGWMLAEFTVSVANQYPDDQPLVNDEPVPIPAYAEHARHEPVDVPDDQPRRADESWA